jgi:hypothetical protein
MTPENLADRRIKSDQPLPWNRHAAAMSVP